jgi:hypothetical protein
MDDRMTTKAVVLKRNPNDKAKQQQLAAIKPLLLVEYGGSGLLSNTAKDFGNLDYLLVTGGHGDFAVSQPTKFNDTTMDDAGKWVAASAGQFKAVILDTCFSSAMLPVIMPLVQPGGCVVCAHGTGEGWAMGFDKSNANKSVADVLGDIVDNATGMGLIPSIAFTVKPTAEHQTAIQIVHTMNAGTQRKSGRATKLDYGMEADSEVELEQLDMYLFKSNFKIEETQGGEQLKMLLGKKLTMSII